LKILCSLINGKTYKKVYYLLLEQGGLLISRFHILEKTEGKPTKVHCDRFSPGPVEQTACQVSEPAKNGAFGRRNVFFLKDFMLAVILILGYKSRRMYSEERTSSPEYYYFSYPHVAQKLEPDSMRLNGFI
jgi:hypothetical protein